MKNMSNKQKQLRALIAVILMAGMMLSVAVYTYAESGGRTSIISFDFGSKHTDFVQKHFGNRTDVGTDGSVVKVTIRNDDQRLPDAVSTLMNILAEDLTDNGEQIMYYYGRILVGRHKREDYADEEEYRQDQEKYFDAPVTDNMLLYILWAQPVEATITVTPPECGTKVEYIDKTGSYVWAQPGPNLAISGGCHFRDYYALYTDWDLSEYGIHGLSDGPLIMKGGNSYIARFYLSADWGYFFPENFADTIKVKGGTLISQQNNPYKISVPVKHTVPDNYVITEPTCSETGSKTYTCPGCGDKVVEVIPALGHSFSYTGSGATITAKCEHDKCDITDVLTLTLSAPTELVNDGTAKEATINPDYNQTAFPDQYDIAYFRDGTSLEKAPVDAGTYTAQLTIGTATAKVEYTIQKAESAVTPPEAKIGLIYSENAQELITAGTTDDGEMQSALGESGETEPENGWSIEIPTGTDAGTYYVWYKAVGDANHFDSKAACVEVTIATGYSCTEGEGAEWTKGSETGLDFTIKGSPDDTGTFKKFTGLASDDSAVALSNYTASPGSVKLTLKPEWLETLAAGKHTLTADFTDGKAETFFTVKDAAPTEEPTEAPTATPTPKPTATPKPVPKTGDSAPLALWLGLIIFGLIALGGTLAWKAKKHH